MDVSEFEQGLLRLGRKIHAIKAYNERTGVGLVTAKRTVDAAWERLVELGDIS
jgi:ribosomal protein L7/L12